MDDLQFGMRNKRGDWAPKARIEVAPIYAMPPKPIALLKWLPHYFLPWNLLFAASALAYWRFIVPSAETREVSSRPRRTPCGALNAPCAATSARASANSARA